MHNQTHGSQVVTGFIGNQSSQTVVHSNLDNEIIQINHDKLQLILTDHSDSLEARKSWITPFSLLLTFLAVLSTSNFTKTFGLEPEVIKAIFVILTFISLGWLIVTLIKLKNSKSITELMCKIKNSNEDSTPTP